MGLGLHHIDCKWGGGSIIIKGAENGFEAPLLAW